MPDLEDYRALNEKRQKERINGERHKLEYLHQAALRAELLTGDPNWDRYLSYLQAAKETWEEEMEAAKANLSSPLMVDTQEIMLLKMRIAQLGAQIATIDACISMPKDLMEKDKEVKDLLKRLDG